MKLHRKASLWFGSLLCALALSSRADAIRQVIAFGDSITDSCQYGAKYVVDRALNSTKGHPGKPYYQECFFSNGPTYALVAARQLNVSLTNYAVGGATAGFASGRAALPAGFGNNSKVAYVDLPTITQQAQTYISSRNGSVPSDALYIVHIGANDYLSTVNSGSNHTETVEQVLDYTAAAMDSLYKAGARVFHTQTQPVWGETPHLQGGGLEDVADGNEISETHNEALGPFLRDFAAGHLEASVILFDYAIWQQALLANATANGFTNTTEACYSGSFEGDGDGVCDNPEEYIHWDDLHFSGHTHRLWGEAVAAQLRPFVTPNATQSTRTTAGRKMMSRRQRRSIMTDDMFGRPLTVYN